MYLSLHEDYSRVVRINYITDSQIAIKVLQVVLLSTLSGAIPMRLQSVYMWEYYFFRMPKKHILPFYDQYREKYDRKKIRFNREVTNSEHHVWNSKPFVWSKSHFFNLSSI